MPFENDPKKSIAICRVTGGKFTQPKVCIKQQIPGSGFSLNANDDMSLTPFPIPTFSVPPFLPWEEGSGEFSVGPR